MELRVLCAGILRVSTIKLREAAGGVLTLRNIWETLEGMRGKAPVKVEEPLGQIGRRRQVVIPLSIFKSLDFRPGDFVAFSRHRGGLLLTRRYAAAAERLTTEEARRLRLSLKQRRQGKTRRWADIENELGL